MSDRYEKRDELPEIYLKKPLEWEVFFQKEEHVVFSPATQETFSLENIILVVAIVKLCKTPEGIKTLEKLAIKYLDSTTKIMESIERGCHSNWLTALNNQHIAAGMLHRIGLLDDGAYIKCLEHYRAVFDKLLISDVALGALSGIGTLIEGGGGFKEMGELATIIKAMLPK